MPSIDARRVSLWARVAGACAVVGAVALALLAFESVLFGVVAYGALVLFDGAVRAVAPAVGVASDSGVAPAGALLATLALFVVAGGTYRVHVRPDEEIDAGFRILAGAYVALIAASLVLTDWAIRWLGFPRWVLAGVLVTLIALFYPMTLYKVATSETVDTDDGPSWRTDGASDDTEATGGDGPTDTDHTTGGDRAVDDASATADTDTSRIARLRRRLRENRRENVARWRAQWEQRRVAAVTVAAEIRRSAAVPYRSHGLPGAVAVAFLVACLFGAPFALADSRSALLTALAAAVGVAVTAVHLGGELRAELAETVVLRELDRRFGEVTDAGSGPDADITDRVRGRLTRLAAGADLPTPVVRVVRSRAPTAAAVGYRPAASTVVVSTGLVDALDGDELDAVLAHELAHVANRDAAALTALSVPRVAARRAFERYGLNPVVALLAGLAALVGRFCTAVVARAREYAADDGAVAITGDPAALASALATLDGTVARRPGTDLRAVAAFSVVPPAWEEHRFFDRTRRLIYRGLLGTHPETSDRIERLRARAGDRERGE